MRPQYLVSLFGLTTVLTSLAPTVQAQVFCSLNPPSPIQRCIFRRPNSFPRPVIRVNRPTFPTILRDGVQFEDHSRTTRIRTARGSSIIGLSEAFDINSTSLTFDRNLQRIEVRLIDTTGRLPSPQVVRILETRGNVLTAQAASLQILGTSSTFRVEVLIFENGQPNRFAMPGLLTVRT